MLMVNTLGTVLHLDFSVKHFPLQGLCSSCVAGLLLLRSSQHTHQSDQDEGFIVTKPTILHHGVPQHVHVTKLWSGQLPAQVCHVSNVQSLKCTISHVCSPSSMQMCNT